MTRTEKEAKNNTPQENIRYCSWCWYHDVGNCKKCALHKNKKGLNNETK